MSSGLMRRTGVNLGPLPDWTGRISFPLTIDSVQLSNHARYECSIPSTMYYHLFRLTQHVLLLRIIDNVTRMSEPVFGHLGCDTTSCLNKPIDWIWYLSQPIAMPSDIRFDLQQLNFNDMKPWARMYLRVLNDSSIGVRSGE